MGKFYIKQKVFSLRDRFTVTDEYEQISYTIEGSFMQLPKRFVIKDFKENLISTITKKTFTWLPKFFIEVDGQEVLTIKKDLTFFKPHYQIEGADLDIQGDWIDKNFEVFRYGELVARVSEKWFTWGDTFEIDVLDESLEHIIIALVIAIDCVNADEEANTIT